MDIFMAQLVNGLAVGSIYSLLVTGFNIMVLVGGVVQYAYPHIVVISMYAAWYVLQATSGNLALTATAAILTAVLLSIATEPIFRPMVKRKALNQSLVVSLGVAMILTHIMSNHMHHGMPISFTKTLAVNKAIASIGMITISAGQLLTFIGTILAVAGFMILLYRTMTGRAFRSMAQNPFVARLLGIPIIKTALISYGVAGLLAGVTAVFLAMALGSAYPALGDTLALKMIATVLFAGIGNLSGGMICGLILGMAESLTTGYLRGQWANAVAFAMIMIVVMFKPQGLFGTKA